MTLFADRDPAHERDILLGLAAHHEAMAETAGDPESRADHQSAARGCRSSAAEWQRIADERARRPVHRPAQGKRR